MGFVDVPRQRSDVQNGRLRRRGRFRLPAGTERLIWLKEVVLNLPAPKSAPCLGFNTSEYCLQTFGTHRPQFLTISKTLKSCTCVGQQTQNLCFQNCGVPANASGASHTSCGALPLIQYKHCKQQSSKKDTQHIPRNNH